MNITSNHKNLSAPISGLIEKPSYKVVLAWFVGGLLISVVSGILSFLLTIVISLSPHLRTGSGSIIIFTLLINCVFNAFIQPVYLVQVLFAQTDRTVEIHCPTYMVIRATFIFAEYWSALSLAINRLVAIIFPHRYKVFTTRVPIGAAILICVLAPFLVNMPTLFNFSAFKSGKYPPLMACTKKPSNELLAIICSTIGTYFPLTLLGVVYIGIACYVKLRKVAEKGKKMARQLMVAKMLFTSYFLFLICFIPLSVMGTFYPFILYRNAELLMWLVMVQLIGFATTPVVFLVINEEYRNCMVNLFEKCELVRHCQPPLELTRPIAVSRNRIGALSKTICTSEM